MEDYLKRILNNDMSIVHGVYEPPNNIPILRYKANNEDYKIVVLGTDSMILSCLNWLATENISPDYVFNNLNDLDQLNQSYKYFLILTDVNYKYPAFQSKLIKKMNDNNIKDYLCPYDYEKIPRHDIEYLEYFQRKENEILQMLNMLHDDESKEIYVEYIRTKMYADFYRLKQNPTWIKYFDKDVYNHISDETFVNCGSSNGDTVFYYLENFKDDFKRIYALEGDKERVRQFQDNLNYIPENIRKKVISINTYVDNMENKIDYVCNNDKVSLINMDIEGMELEALKGAKQTILENKPVIAACAYHLPTDLYDLPMYIKNLSDEYEIFYRKYASTFRNKLKNSELVMYAVPQKRLVK